MEQWHPSKNGDKTPASVPLGSPFMAWWLCRACNCGQSHEWQASINKRALANSGCPFCAGAHPCRCNSLAALRPELAAEWHPAGNGELKPEDVSLSSSRKVLWVCHKHSAPFTWATSIYARTRRNKPSGCPQCALKARGPKQGRHGSSTPCAVMSGSTEGRGTNRGRSDH